MAHTLTLSLQAPLQSSDAPLTVEPGTHETSETGSTQNDPDSKRLLPDPLGHSNAPGLRVPRSAEISYGDASAELPFEEEAIKRVLLQEELHWSGVLADEVRRLGVDPE
jgi:hypothetical protein